MIPIKIIVAIDENNGIGKDGRLPWHLSGDLKHFKDITCAVNSPLKQNVVIMGRKTWDSIPENFRPLSGRINVVLTRNKKLEFPKGVFSIENLDKALSYIQNFNKNSTFEENFTLMSEVESIFVIGGEEVFKTALTESLHHIKKLYVTHILKSFQCDTIFPPFLEKFATKSSSSRHNENSISYYYAEYVPKSINKPLSTK